MDSFSASELGDNVTPADPASIPEGIKTYVDLTTTGMYLYTTDSFTEAVLTGDVFSSGTSSTSDPDVVKGNTLYLCFTTYLGQEVQIPFVFNYKDGEPEPTPAPIILFSEDFENNFVEERSEDWTFIDADGDGFNWNYWDDVEYNNHFNHYSGIGHISSESYNNNYGSFTPDNWAVTPAITLSSVSNYLSFWVGAQDPSWTEEFYAVYLTTDEQPSSDPDDYVVLMAGETFGTSEPFETYDNGENRVVYRYVITIPDEYKGATVHIAFRHFNCSDNFRLNLDDVYVTETAPVVGDQEDTINPDPEPEPNPDPLPENILFLEDFEGDLDDWTFWDQDGDGYNWEFEDYYAASGSYSLTSRSYYGGALDPDNWAITPAITLSSESNYLSVYDMNYLGSWLDKYDILISAGESMTKDSFVKLAGYVPATVWTLRTIQIPDEYKGQTVHIAFRHWDSYDNFRLFIDDVTVYFGSLSGPSPVAPHFNVADGKYDFRKQLGASAREQIGLAEKMK